MPGHHDKFSKLKKGSFKNYLKNTEKVPGHLSTEQAARYILRNKDSNFHPRTVRRARMVIIAAKNRR